MNIKLKIILLFGALALIASSCPDERPELVTPPSYSETVNVRFLNLTRSVPLALAFDDLPVSDYVGKYKMSKSFHPLNDSAFISVLEGNNKVNELEKVVMFSRELNYIYTAIPNPKDYSRDTIYGFTNIGDIVVSEVEASVKFINLYADTNARFTFVRGCPGGEQINSSPLDYMDNTPAEPERAGDEFVFSLIKYMKNGDFELIGTFKSKFTAFGEYTILVSGREGESPEIFMIDELDLQQNILNDVGKVESQVAYIKQVNLSDESDKLNLSGMELISTNVNDVSSFVEIGACQTASSETFSNGSGFEVEFTPEVNTQFIALSYNVSSTINRELMIISPPVLNQNRSNKAVVRCVNLANESSGLNISLGANSNFINKYSNDTIRNFSTGLSLASKLAYKDMSTPKIIDAGLMPILIFNSQEPAQYIYSFLHRFEADKNYLIVSYIQNGIVKYTVLEQGEESSSVQEKSESAIINIVNGDKGSQSHKINLNCSEGQILNNAQLIFANTITSSVSAGSVDIGFSGSNSNINTQSGLRYYSIKTDKSIFEFSNPKQNIDYQAYQFRLANLSDIERARIKTISGIDTAVKFVKSDFGTMTNYTSVNSQGRIFVMIENRDNDEFVFTSPEVNVNRGKVYTYILVGNKENGYKLITLQDY